MSGLRILMQLSALFCAVVVSFSVAAERKPLLLRTFGNAPLTEDTRSWIRQQIYPYPFLFSPLRVLVSIEGSKLLGDPDAFPDHGRYYAEIMSYLAPKGLWLGMSESEIEESLRTGTVAASYESAIDCLDVSLKARRLLLKMGILRLEDAVGLNWTELRLAAGEMTGIEIAHALKRHGIPVGGGPRYAAGTSLRKFGLYSRTYAKLSESGFTKIEEIVELRNQQLFELGIKGQSQTQLRQKLCDWHARGEKI